MIRSLHVLVVLSICGSAVLVAQRQEPPAPQQPARQSSQVELIIGDRIGAQTVILRYRIVLALTRDDRTLDAARTIAEVLWNDLEFEREFRMLPRDTYKTIPVARSVVNVPLDRWSELGADGVVSCSTERLSDEQIRVTARLFNVQQRSAAFNVEYTGSWNNVRVYAHQLSDEIHRHQRGLRGVARTKISFVSDRDSESLLGLVEDRQTKEVYFADYDGANIRRVTVSRSLNITPVWSPNGRSIAYTSWRRGYQDVFVSHIYDGRLESPAGGTRNVQNWLPAWSPDGHAARGYVKPRREPGAVRVER